MPLGGVDSKQRMSIQMRLLSKKLYNSEGTNEKVVESKDNDTWELSGTSENTHGEVPEEQCWEVKDGESQIRYSSATR